MRKVVEGNIADHWLYLHIETAMGHEVEDEEIEGILSDSLRQTAIASAEVQFTGEEVPDWLQVPPSGTAPYDKNAVPVDWAAGRLVERHRLPWRAVRSLVYYILTENSEWVAEIEPLSIGISYGDVASDMEAFTVSIIGIDEYTTEQDWNRVWSRYIRPQQDYLWERRGMKPQGRRRVDISRLQKVLPLYQKMVRGRQQFGKLLRDPHARRDKTTGELIIEWDEEIEDIIGELDQETIRRAITKLQKLLRPMSQ